MEGWTDGWQKARAVIYIHAYTHILEPIPTYRKVTSIYFPQTLWNFNVHTLTGAVMILEVWRMKGWIDRQLVLHEMNFLFIF
ncbi:hypothetical protein EYC80_005182 [Monilinia laxa]|uniref:Uncharacterized protein n=1 Tax=Monilinia laxa TaxID=61186 RepID=A0A5N6KJG3_MONLA|nr:hypothetical protein EYC80_005182 [Monilinia laxa]